MAGVLLLHDPGVISIRLSGAVRVQERVDVFEALLDLQAKTSCRRAA